MVKLIAPLDKVHTKQKEKQIYKDMVKRGYKLSITISPRLTDMTEEQFTAKLDKAIALTNKRLHHKNGVSLYGYLEHSPWIHFHGVIKIKTQLRKKKPKSYCLKVLADASQRVFGEQCEFHKDELYHPEGWFGYSTKQDNSSVHMS